ncbi:MAG: hypothetical protein WAS94_01445 [Candidatus Saccharimonadales bacterium]
MKIKGTTLNLQEDGDSSDFSSGEQAKARSWKFLPKLFRLDKNEKSIIKLYLWNRIILTIIAMIFTGLVGQANPTDSLNTLHPAFVKNAPQEFSSIAPLNLWGNWDSGWYLRIANEGYKPSINQANQASIVFMPMYPLLVNVVSKVTFLDKFLVGLILSNIFFVVFLILFYRYFKLHFDEVSAKYASIAIIAYPFGYYFSSFYGESLFLLAIFLTITGALNNRWRLSGLGLFVAILTKLNGWILCLPLAWIMIRKLITIVKSKPRKVTPVFNQLASYLWVIAGFIGAITIYLSINKLVFGNYFAFMDIEKAGWNKQLYNPVILTFNYIKGSAANALFASVGILALLASIICLIKIKPFREFGLFFSVAMILYLSTGMEGITRYSIPVLPIYALIGLLTAGHYNLKTDRSSRVSSSLQTAKIKMLSIISDNHEAIFYTMFMLQALFMALWVGGHPFLM